MSTDIIGKFGKIEAVYLSSYNLNVFRRIMQKDCYSPIALELHSIRTGLYWKCYGKKHELPEFWQLCFIMLVILLMRTFISDPSLN